MEERSHMVRFNSIKKSIYMELMAALLIFICISIAIFFVLTQIFIKTGTFTEEHEDYQLSRAKAVDELFEFMSIINSRGNEMYNAQTLKDTIKDMSGVVYVTDLWGNIIATNIPGEYSYSSDAINIESWKEKSNEFNNEAEYCVLYPFSMTLGMEKIDCYMGVSSRLEPTVTYTYEWVYMAAGIISAVLFFTMIFFCIRSKMIYIRYLSNAVKEISKGNLNYEVKIIGSDELSMVASSINDMERKLVEKIELQQKENAKTKSLITNMSHDLKTPITVVLGYLDVLINNQYKGEEEMKLYMQTAYEKTLGLKDIVVRLFELVKSGDTSSQLNLSEVNLARLLRQMVIEYDLIIAEKKLMVSSRIPVKNIKMYLDVEKITSALDNIMTNCVKYCTQYGNIEVVLQEEEQSILISVANSCNYMNEEELENIFEKFYRGDKARNSDIEGNGIGLALVKEIIELHNGKVWAEYRKDKIFIMIRLRKM